MLIQLLEFSNDRQAPRETDIWLLVIRVLGVNSGTGI